MQPREGAGRRVIEGAGGEMHVRAHEVEGLQARRDALADGTSLGSLCTSRPTTPYGGSSEIQQNSLASQVLGLPS